MPALFSGCFVNAVFAEQEIRIVEHFGGHFKIDAAVFPDVCAFLVPIPFETHRKLYRITKRMTTRTEREHYLYFVEGRAVKRPI